MLPTLPTPTRGNTTSFNSAFAAYTETVRSLYRHTYNFRNLSPADMRYAFESVRRELKSQRQIRQQKSDLLEDLRDSVLKICRTKRYTLFLSIYARTVSSLLSIQHVRALVFYCINGSW